MKKKLAKLSNKLENANNKKSDVEFRIKLYKDSRSGFMSSYSICSIFIFSLSFGSILLSYILPSYIVGYLALIINSVSVSFLIYLLSENKTNLKVMEKLNLNKLELELNKCNKEIDKYDNEYKKLVEMVMLGDDVWLVFLKGIMVWRREL